MSNTPDYGLYEYKIVVDGNGGYDLSVWASDGWEFVQAVTAEHAVTVGWRVICIMKRKRR